MPNPVIFFIRTTYFPHRSFPWGWTGRDGTELLNEYGEMKAIFLADNNPVPVLTHTNRSADEILLVVEHSGSPISAENFAQLRSIGRPFVVRRYSNADPTFFGILNRIFASQPIPQEINQFLSTLDVDGAFMFLTECAAELQIRMLTKHRDRLDICPPPECVDDLARWNHDLLGPITTEAILKKVVSRAETLVG